MQIVIVPGFTGSGLSGDDKEGDLVNVWFNKSWISVYGLDDLQLASGGLAPGPLSNLGTMQAAGDPFQLYRGLKDACAQLPGVKAVKWWPWDWRIDMTVSAGQLASFLSPILATDTVAVIAHSAGGLLARLAYNQLRNTGNLANWLRTVYLGTPHGGSYCATQGLAGWLPDLTWWQMFAVGLGLLRRRILNPASSLDSVTQRIAQVLASWPALAQLQPNPGGQYAALDDQASAAYQFNPWQLANPYVNQHTWLANAVAFWNTINALVPQPAGTEVDVICTQYTTPREFFKTDQLSNPNGYVLSSEAGDGVVSTQRAVHGTVPQVTISAPHQSMPMSGELIRALPQLLASTPPVTETLLDPPTQNFGPDLPALVNPGVKGPLIEPFKIRRGDP